MQPAARGSCLCHMCDSGRAASHQGCDCSVSVAAAVFFADVRWSVGVQGCMCDFGHWRLSHAVNGTMCAVLLAPTEAMRQNCTASLVKGTNYATVDPCKIRHHTTTPDDLSHDV
jgi:hypothetical protein